MSKHRDRVYRELREAGMTLYGMQKMETHYLPELIHADEHVYGVVYGRSKEKIGSAMLVATDKRIIYLDAKPFFRTFDEVTYEVVAGVKVSDVGMNASVILHTRVVDYNLRFVNTKCAKKFSHYIESHIEALEENGTKPTTSPPVTPAKTLPRIKPVADSRKEEDDVAFLKSHSTAVLSTIDRTGNVHGAVVHYTVTDQGIIHIVTKADTEKARNIAVHGQVAMTIHDAGSLKTLQLSGYADKETDPHVSALIFSEISKPRDYIEGTKLPPITSMRKGDYVVVRIVPSSLKYHDYSKSSW